MATALYATMLVQPGNVEQIQRYLYAPTEIVEAAPIVEYREDGSRETGRLVFLVLRTEERDQATAERAQQTQCDRLASGLHAMTVGFSSRYDAQQHAVTRATDNDWGLAHWAPFHVAATV